MSGDSRMEYPSREEYYNQGEYHNQEDHHQKYHDQEYPAISDYGTDPLVVQLNYVTNRNRNFRTTLWTGQHMQLTLMCIPVGGEIGLESHPEADQFIGIESGKARVYMGSSKNNLHDRTCVNENSAILIPAGTWHNIVNTGTCPLKLYSIYAPPQHPFGTVHRTKEDAEHEEY